MRWLLLGAGLIGALVVSAPAAAMAPKARDVTATRRFIAAETRFDRAELARGGAITKATNAYLRRVKAGCAGDMPVTLSTGGPPPQRKVYLDLVKEASFDLYAASTRPVQHAELGLLHALRRVHFTQPRLAGVVSEIVLGNEPATPNNLCADVKAAQAAHFAAEPAGTARLLRRVAPQLSGGTSTQLPGGLRPYLITSADQAAYKTLQALDKRYAAFTNTFVLTETVRLVSILTR
jgi:hypothetical protein